MKDENQQEKEVEEFRDRMHSILEDFAVMGTADFVPEKSGLTKVLISLSAGSMMYKDIDPEHIDAIAILCQNALSDSHKKLLRRKHPKLIAGIDPIVEKFTSNHGSQCMVLHLGYAFLESSELGIDCLAYMAQLCDLVGKGLENHYSLVWEYRGYQLHNPVVEAELKDRLESDYRWKVEDVPYVWNHNNGKLTDTRVLYSEYPKEHICLQ